MNKITYEPEEMSLIMQSYEEAAQLKFNTMPEYMTWRTRLIPFLAQDETEGRELIYNLAFITVILYSSEESKAMCRLILKNILDTEMTERIKEIEKSRKVKP